MQEYRYKVAVNGWGYTYCDNGIELDHLMRHEIQISIYPNVTITVEEKPNDKA